MSGTPSGLGDGGSMRDGDVGPTVLSMPAPAALDVSADTGSIVGDAVAVLTRDGELPASHHVFRVSLGSGGLRLVSLGRAERVRGCARGMKVAGDDDEVHAELGQALCPVGYAITHPLPSWDDGMLYGYTCFTRAERGAMHFCVEGPGGEVIVAQSAHAAAQRVRVKLWERGIPISSDVRGMLKAPDAGKVLFGLGHRYAGGHLRALVTRLPRYYATLREVVAQQAAMRAAHSSAAGAGASSDDISSSDSEGGPRGHDGDGEGGGGPAVGAAAHDLTTPTTPGPHLSHRRDAYCIPVPVECIYRFPARWQVPSAVPAAPAPASATAAEARALAAVRDAARPQQQRRAGSGVRRDPVKAFLRRYRQQGMGGSMLE